MIHNIYEDLRLTPHKKLTPRRVWRLCQRRHEPKQWTTGHLAIGLHLAGAEWTTSTERPHKTGVYIIHRKTPSNHWEMICKTGPRTFLNAEGNKADTKHATLWIRVTGKPNAKTLAHNLTRWTPQQRTRPADTPRHPHDRIGSQSNNIRLGTLNVNGLSDTEGAYALIHLHGLHILAVQELKRTNLKIGTAQWRRIQNADRRNPGKWYTATSTQDHEEAETAVWLHHTMADKAEKIHIHDTGRAMAITMRTSPPLLLLAVHWPVHTTTIPATIQQIMAWLHQQMLQATPDTMVIMMGDENEHTRQEGERNGQPWTFRHTPIHEWAESMGLMDTLRQQEVTPGHYTHWQVTDNTQMSRKDKIRSTEATTRHICTTPHDTTREHITTDHTLVIAETQMGEQNWDHDYEQWRPPNAGRLQWATKGNKALIITDTLLPQMDIQKQLRDGSWLVETTTEEARNMVEHKRAKWPRTSWERYAQLTANPPTQPAALQQYLTAALNKLVPHGQERDANKWTITESTQLYKLARHIREETITEHDARQEAKQWNIEATSLKELGEATLKLAMTTQKQETTEMREQAVADAIERKLQQLHQDKGRLIQETTQDYKKPWVDATLQDGGLVLDKKKQADDMQATFENWVPDMADKMTQEVADMLCTDHYAQVLDLHDNRQRHAPKPGPAPRNILEPITMEELLGTLNKNTAAGHDGITFKAIKHAHPQVRITLLNVLNQMLQDPDTYPDAWGTSILIPIPKLTTTTDTYTVVPDGKYRPIALLCTMHKCLTAVLTKRHLQDDIDNNYLGDNTYGFRRRRNTSGAILAMEARTYTRRHDTRVIITTTDVSKAFDATRQHQVIATYRREGHGPEYAKLRLKMFEKAHQRVLTPLGLGKPIRVRGLPQGDNISVSDYPRSAEPMITAMEQTPDTWPSVFADDTQLLTTSKEATITALNIMNTHLKEHKQTLSIPKCTCQAYEDPGISIEGERIRHIQPHDIQKYLGVYMTLTGHDKLFAKLMETANDIAENLRLHNVDIAAVRYSTR